MNVVSSTAVVEAETRRGSVDLSDELSRAIEDSRFEHGFVLAFCAHTTCALVINEWEDGLLADVGRRLEELVPENAYYAHDDLGVRTQNLVGDERRNGPAHVATIVLGGTSHAIPFVQREPQLGRWQRLYLLELDDPKPRIVSFHVYG